MATNTVKCSPNFLENMLVLHGENVLLNEEIKKLKNNFKNNPSAQNNFPQIIQTLFNVENYINKHKPDVSPEGQNYYSTLELAVSQTHNRVEKLKQKFPQFTVISNDPIQQMAQRANTEQFVSFYDDQTDSLTGCFGNFHSCKNPIEFGGKKYTNSEAVFQAHKFTDQPNIFSLFDDQTDGDTAVKITRQNRMTSTRLAEWDDRNLPNVNKIDVMMNVLRAKFGQNLELKSLLMATGSTYLVEHLPDSNRSDRCWSDGYDGNGENMLGICLMRLRQEYGGTGVVSKPQTYLSMIQNQSQPSQQTISFQERKICMMPDCTKVVFQGHKFCGKTHGMEYTEKYGLCNRCKMEPKYCEKNLDGTAKRVHDFCKRSCSG